VELNVSPEQVGPVTSGGSEVLWSGVVAFVLVVLASAVVTYLLLRAAHVTLRWTPGRVAGAGVLLVLSALVAVVVR
jgi:hypothetical protein